MYPVSVPYRDRHVLINWRFLAEGNKLRDGALLSFSFFLLRYLRVLAGFCERHMWHPVSPLVKLWGYVWSYGKSVTVPSTVPCVIIILIIVNLPYSTSYSSIIYHTSSRVLLWSTYDRYLLHISYLPRIILVSHLLLDFRLQLHNIANRIGRLSPTSLDNLLIRLPLMHQHNPNSGAREGRTCYRCQGHEYLCALTLLPLHHLNSAPNFASSTTMPLQLALSSFTLQMTAANTPYTLLPIVETWDIFRHSC